MDRAPLFRIATDDGRDVSFDLSASDGHDALLVIDAILVRQPNVSCDPAVVQFIIRAREGVPLTRDDFDQARYLAGRCLTM